jgi:hypothetical protein
MRQRGKWQRRQRQRVVSGAVACIGSVGMRRKGMEADGADGATVNTQVSEVVKVVRTRLNWMVLV